MKKTLLALAFLLVVDLSFAQNIEQKRIYNGGVYGQTFQMYEYNDGSRVRLELYLQDNKTKIVDTYSASLATVYSIKSKWFTNAGDYSKSERASQDFLDYGLNLVSLADMKDICDIAPCCKSTDYGIKKTSKGVKYIYIEYECSDLPLLFEVARVYNKNGRDDAMERYGR